MSVVVVDTSVYIKSDSIRDVFSFLRLKNDIFGKETNNDIYLH